MTRTTDSDPSNIDGRKEVKLERATKPKPANNPPDPLELDEYWIVLWDPQ